MQNIFLYVTTETFGYSLPSGLVRWLAKVVAVDVDLLGAHSDDFAGAGLLGQLLDAVLLLLLLLPDLPGQGDHGEKQSA